MFEDENIIISLAEKYLQRTSTTPIEEDIKRLEDIKKLINNTKSKLD